MQIDSNPFFRKIITPWYDSNFTCWTLIIIMLFVFAFALIGILVGASHLAYKEYIWFPVLLAFLSMFLVIKIILRLRIRYQN